MHVRFSPCLGMPVIEDLTEDVLGAIAGIVINPDTCAIEGFSVRPSGLFFHKSTLFLSRFDVMHWGRAVRIRDHRVLSTPEEIVRLQSLLQDPRTVMGQKMKTDGGLTLGICKDVQFNTRTFDVEWLFPRRFFRWGLPAPAVEILEIRPDAIILQDPGRAKIVKTEKTILETIVDPVLQAPPTAS